MPQAPSTEEIKEYYRDELTDLEFYKRLSAKTADEDFRKNLERLSEIEKEHAKFWKMELERRGVKTTKIKYKKAKVRFLIFIRRILGPYLTVRLLEHGEINTVVSYTELLHRYEKEDEFRNTLERIIHEEIEHEEIFENRIEKTEKDIQRNRDVIYGISDGLVEVLASISGLTALIVNNLDIALGGLVVALGGSISMALGAYLAKNSETEYRISELRKKALFSQKRANREEIKDYEGESRRSALNVGMFYIMGAVIPILPFVVLERHIALIISIILVAITQGISNGIVALSMNIKILRSSIRAAGLSLIAAAGTYAVGELFHILFNISLF